MDDEPQFIRGIFNYCDRWCERCEFTSRCRVFADERSRELEYSDDPMGAAIAVLKDSFAEAKLMLMDKAEEMGIDLESAMNDPEVDATIEREHRFVEDNEVFKLARSYALDSDKILKRADQLSPSGDDLTVVKMTEVLHRFNFMISVKVSGGLHGLLDIDGYEDKEQLLDTQSYANGMIKMALILIERSLPAWTYLLNESNAEVIMPQIERLKLIKSLVEIKFPHARDFIRPGFDEIEMVM